MYLYTNLKLFKKPNYVWQNCFGNKYNEVILTYLIKYGLNKGIKHNKVQVLIFYKFK